MMRRPGISMSGLYYEILLSNYKNEYMEKTTMKMYIRTYLNAVSDRYKKTTLGMVIDIALINGSDQVFEDLMAWLHKEIQGNEALVSTVITQPCCDLIKMYCLN